MAGSEASAICQCAFGTCQRHFPKPGWKAPAKSTGLRHFHFWICDPGCAVCRAAVLAPIAWLARSGACTAFVSRVADCGLFRKTLAVLDCGGRDTAFEPCAARCPLALNDLFPPESGVALRLPPHSKTLRGSSTLVAANVSSLHLKASRRKNERTHVRCYSIRLVSSP